MPSPVHTETIRMPPMAPGPFGDLGGTAPPSNAELCERAVRTIWRSLDQHDLVDEQVRAELASVLEPMAALSLGQLPQRLLDTLRLPNPIDASRLYWLTRRLLTLVPLLQAAEIEFDKPGGHPPSVT